MNVTTMVSIGILAAVFIGAGITIWRENRKKKKFFLRFIRKNWGKVPNREYTYEAFESISHFARRREDRGFFIDDITWNDLDMDRIFMLMNQTVSSCGEDYLYYTLRSPEFDRAALEEKHRLADYFASHTEEREQVQILLGHVGKTAGMSVSDYIYQLQNVPRQPVFKYIAAALFSLVSIVMIPIQPMVGVLMILVAMMMNMVIFIKTKGDTEMYLNCFQCVLNIVKVSEEFGKLNLPVIAEYTKKMKETGSKFKNFRRGSFLVTTNGAVSTGFDDAILSYLKMLFHLDMIKFDHMLREIEGKQEYIEILMEQIGAVDSAIAIASFREYLPYYCRAQWTGGDRAALEVHDLYHPILDNPVANSISVNGGVLVTGSNASGKSTFLKNIAINSILAQTIDTAVATSYKAPFLKIMTSMALTDSLENGESYYIVEIKSLKRILDEAAKGAPLLCIIDEVLRGTNTIERISASSQILKQLYAPQVLCFAATHDIELSYLLEHDYENYHFEEEVRDGQVLFSYELKHDRASTRNAIKLLEIMDYPKNVVEQARAQAADFEENGVWTLC
ncbi:MAG: DNA mismatch repair protein MutS [Lachnospiraceae bacterium]|nr:DNA mismatch repair protein MutS [Lachnospiraceae bacterium]